MSTSNDNNTPTTPTPTPKTGENTMAEHQTPPTSPETTPIEDTFPKYFAYGVGTNEWLSGSYTKAWIWKSPETLPISPNFYAWWEKLPNEETITEARLQGFLRAAKPISKEEYERLINIKKERHHEDSDMEYRWYGPRYDDDE